MDEKKGCAEIENRLTYRRKKYIIVIRVVNDIVYAGRLSKISQIYNSATAWGVESHSTRLKIPFNEPFSNIVTQLEYEE